MRGETLIVVPVLGRPWRIRPVLESIKKATKDPHVLFVASTHDTAVQLACAEALHIIPDMAWVTVPYQPCGDYSRKTNLAYLTSSHPFLFTAADDLEFHPGWLEAAMEKMDDPQIGVVGTQDLCNYLVLQGIHSTHSLIRRTYVDDFGLIDRPGLVLNEDYPHEFCNPPEAPIWMGDLTFRPLGKVEVGDEVVGWERFLPENTTGRKKFTLNRLCRATVLATARREAALVRVVMASGREFRCTPDHKWYNAAWTPAANRRWADYPQYVEPRVGRWLLHVVDEPPPVPPDKQFLAGWLGGIYDGEGSWIQISQCRFHNPEICKAIEQALIDLGIPAKIGWDTDARNFATLQGGRQGYLNFILWCRPVKRHQIVNKIIGGRRFGHKDQVVSVEPDGFGEVVSLTTTSGNYIANGYASKNCDDELVETAKSRNAFAFAPGSIVEHLHPSCGKADWDDLYHNNADRVRVGSALFHQRRHLWGGGDW